MAGRGEKMEAVLEGRANTCLRMLAKIELFFVTSQRADFINILFPQNRSKTLQVHPNTTSLAGWPNHLAEPQTFACKLQF